MLEMSDVDVIDGVVGGEGHDVAGASRVVDRCPWPAVAARRQPARGSVARDRAPRDRPSRLGLLSVLHAGGCGLFGG